MYALEWLASIYKKINGIREFKDAAKNYLLLQCIGNVIYWLSDTGSIHFLLILITPDLIYVNHFINFYKMFRTLRIYQIGICDVCMFEMYTLTDNVISMLSCHHLSRTTMEIRDNLFLFVLSLALMCITLFITSICMSVFICALCCVNNVCISVYSWNKIIIIIIYLQM